MGGYFLWHVISDPSANLLGALDEEISDLWKSQWRLPYQLRTADLERDRTPFAQLWYRSMFMGGDPTTSPFLWGQDMNDGGHGWEPWPVLNEGTYRPYYVEGNVTGPDNTSLSGVAVYLFLTGSPPVFCSSGTTDNNGNYSLATPYTGRNHFVYAVYGANTYVGATSSSLTPNA